MTFALLMLGLIGVFALAWAQNRDAIRNLIHKKRTDGPHLPNFGHHIELTRKDDEESGELSLEMCAVMWGVIDFKNGMSPKAQIILPSYCVAKECRTVITRPSKEELFIGNLWVTVCDTHKPIAIRHAHALGLEIVRAPRLK